MVAITEATSWPFDRGKTAVLKARSRKIRTHGFSLLPFRVESVYVLESQELDNSSKLEQAAWTKKTRDSHRSSFFRLELSVRQAREPRARQLLKNEVISSIDGRQTSGRKSILSMQFCHRTACVEALSPFSSVARMQKCMPENDEPRDLLYHLMCETEKSL